jgi:Flp pilus assembly protein TadG
MAQVNTRRSRWANEDGAQLVEFALVLPLLLLVVLAIAEFGFLFQRYEVLTNAAREGARIAVLPGYTQADVEARVEAYLTAGGVPFNDSNLTIPAMLNVATPTSVGPVNSRRVTVNYTYTFQFLSAIDEWFDTSYTTLPMTAVSEMRIEVPAAP